MIRKTILFTTHSIKMATELPDKLILIHKGKLITIGNPEEVISIYKQTIKK